MIDLFEKDEKNNENTSPLTDIQNGVVDDIFEEDVLADSRVEVVENSDENNDFLTQKTEENDLNFNLNEEVKEVEKEVAFTFEEEKTESEEAVSEHIYQSSFENFNGLDNLKRPEIELDYDNFGLTFRRLREAAGVDLDSLNNTTRIPLDYLMALEEEDYERLPKEVYIVGYIRKLGNIYHLSEDEICRLSKKVRDQMELELPEEGEGKTIIDHEPSEENLIKLKKIIAFFVVSIVILVALIIGLIAFFKHDGKTKTVYEKSFRSEDILNIQDTPKLEKYVLPFNN